MASSRICKAAFCFAASVLLSGAPVIAQETMGGSSGSSGSNGTQSSGSQSGSSSRTGVGTSTGSAQTAGGGMQGSSASGMSDSSGSAKISAADKHFMMEAMEGSMAEIQLGQLAQQKASNDQVKQFGQRMVDDHTKLNAQMAPIAQQFGVEAPTDLSSKHKAVQARLQNLSGDQFDQEYMKAMVNDHREDHQAFLREQNNAKDPTLKNAVSQGEPIIAEHLRMAQDIQKSLKGKSSGSNSSGSNSSKSGSNSSM